MVTPLTPRSPETWTNNKYLINQACFNFSENKCLVVNKYPVETKILARNNQLSRKYLNITKFTITTATTTTILGHTTQCICVIHYKVCFLQIYK